MSRLRKASGSSSSIANAIRTTLQNGDIKTHVSAQHASKVAGLESLSGQELGQVEQTNSQVQSSLESIFGDHGNQVNQIGLESASIVAMASEDPESYAGGDHRSRRASDATVMAMPMNGAVSNEAYDLGDLKEHMSASIQYNYEAPRQDAFGEALFPTVIATPDQAYFEAVCERIMVGEDVARNKTGNTVNWQRRNLIQAFRDHSILANDSTDLIPNATDGNSDYFVDTGDVANASRRIAGVDVATRPLKFDVGEIDLIGLSSNTALIDSGVMTQTDQIDPKVTVRNLYIKMTNGVGDTSEVLKFPVHHLSGAGFVPAVEGHERDMNLRFKTTSLPLSASAKQVDGSASTLLNGETGKTYLSIMVNGSLNLDSGVLDMTSRPANIAYSTDASGKEVSTPTAIEDANIEIIGYDIDARRSNSNQRTTGKLLTVSNYRQAYMIPITAPFRVQQPALQNADAVDRAVKALVNATHVAISNSAVTTLVNYREQLAAYFAEGAEMPTDFDPSVFEGIGAQLVTPFYAEAKVDATEVVNSISSSDKRSDIAGYFTTLIAEMAARLANESGYVPALRLETGNQDARPHLTIGTNMVLSQFLMMIGDERILGPQMDFDIVTTTDSRVAKKIFLTFTQNKEGFSPLNFGNMIWIPELMGTLPISRSGSTSKETVVQPRYRHICNLPVMGVIEVDKIEELTLGRVSGTNV